MSEVMAYVMGESDFGDELLTSFQNDDDDDEFDIDDEMYYLYEEEPPSYDIVARLKEVNDALQKEIMPPEYEDRDRKVTFKENPIVLEISAYTEYSDDEEEEDNEEAVDDDDGYGDSTEVSDELVEDAKDVEQVASRIQNDQSSTVDDVEIVFENVPDNKSEFVDSSVENQASDCVLVNDDVDSHCDVVDAVMASEVPTAPQNENEMENEAVTGCLTESTDEPVISLTEKVEIDGFDLASDTVKVETSVVDVPETVLLVPDEVQPSIVNVPESARKAEEEGPVEKSVEERKLNNVTDKSSVNSVAKSTQKTGNANSVKKTEVKSVASRERPTTVRHRSSSVPPRDMIMASKGKFHVMTTDDIQVRSRTASPFRTRSRMEPKQHPTSQNDSLSASSTNAKPMSVVKLDYKTFQLNNRNSRPSTSTELKLKSPPSGVEVGSKVVPSTKPKYTGEGPSGYGLTTAQKMEKKLHAKSTMQNIQEKREETLAEKARKREELDMAYKMWLQKKTGTGSPFRQNSSENLRENGKTKEQDKPKSNLGFEEWLQMKRRQKKRERDLERMKKKVENEISYVKTTEQNRRDFNKYVKTRTKHL